MSLSGADNLVRALVTRCWGFSTRPIDPGHVTATLAEFNQLWDILYPQEKTRIVHLIAERVVYMGEGGIRIFFRISHP